MYPQHFPLLLERQMAAYLALMIQPQTASQIHRREEVLT